jgi:hypothetical protein
MRQSAFQAPFPAIAAVMQVGSPSSQFAGRVHPNSLGGSHNTDHLSLGQNFTTAHASPLGYMFHTLNGFLLGHLCLLYSNNLKPQGEVFDMSSASPSNIILLEYSSLFHHNDNRLLLFFPNFSAALVYLTGNNLAAFLIELQCHTLLLALLAFLFIIELFLTATGFLEDLRLHRKKFIQ